MGSDYFGECARATSCQRLLPLPQTRSLSLPLTSTSTNKSYATDILSPRDGLHTSAMRPDVDAKLWTSPLPLLQSTALSPAMISPATSDLVKAASHKAPISNAFVTGSPAASRLKLPGSSLP